MIPRKGPGYGNSRSIQMAERRSVNQLVSIEPTVFQALQLAMANESLTASSYMRRLLIQDLKEKGLLTTEMLANMAER